jgi:hypothetical protein
MDEIIEALLLLNYKRILPKLAKPRVGKKCKYFVVYKNITYFKSKDVRKI